MFLTCFVLALTMVRQAVEDFIATRALRIQWLAHRVASDEFLRYEMLHFHKLRRCLPVGIYQDCDLIDEIRAFALEAVYTFDPDKAASFPTFLYVHVQHRCIQFKSKAWRKKAYPSDGRWLMNETAYLGDEAALDRCGDSGKSQGLDNLSDRTYRGHLPKDDVEQALGTLRPETAALFKTIAADGELVKLVRRPNTRNRVAEAVGVSRADLDRMVEEVKRKTGVLMEAD